MATFTSLAFIGDPLILLSLWWGTSGWDAETRRNALIAELVWIFAFTKVVKLVGLWRKHPEDIIYWPVSIVFGYFHGLIKLYSLITLNMVCFGSPCIDCFPRHLLTHWGRLLGAADPMVMLTTACVCRLARARTRPL